MSGVEKEEQKNPYAELQKRAAADQATDDEGIIADISIRDRLMRRSTRVHIKNVMADDAGDFIVETRIMTSDERYRGLKAIENMASSKDSERAVDFAEAFKTLAEIVEDIVVTEGLEGYFTGPDVTDDVILFLFMNTLEQTMKRAGGSIESFLEKRPRTEPT